MGKADAFSWKEDHAIGIENNNKELVVISSEQICTNEWIEIYGVKAKILKQIQNAQIQAPTLDGLANEDTGIIKINNKIYIPNANTLRQDIIKLFHNFTIAGHGGIEKTLKLVSCYYYWKGSHAMIKEYYVCCKRCAYMKPMNVLLAGKLNPNPIPKGL